MNKILKVIGGNDISIPRDLADYLCVTDGESVICELKNRTMLLKKGNSIMNHVP